MGTDQRTPQLVGQRGAFGTTAPTAAERELAARVGAYSYCTGRNQAGRELLFMYVQPSDRIRVERATTEAGFGHSSRANAAGRLARIDVLRSDVERGGTYVPE